MWRILAFLSLGFTLLAQNGPTREFSFVVLDSKGNPVTNLKKQEIAVTEDGEPREVIGLRFDGDAETIRTAPLGPGLFTNRVSHLPGPEKNVTAIVIDTLNS